MPDFTKLKELLDSEMEWPAEYMFKFIVPVGQVQLLKALLPTGGWSQRASSNGRYLSVTVNAKFKTSDEVIDIYDKVRHIEGIISL